MLFFFKKHHFLLFFGFRFTDYPAVYADNLNIALKVVTNCISFATQLVDKSANELNFIGKTSRCYFWHVMCNLPRQTSNSDIVIINLHDTHV